MRIQCWYRMIRAVRVVNNRRIWLWCAHKNALKIQSAWRQHIARGIARHAREKRDERRRLRHQEALNRRIAAIEELIRWHRATCEAAVMKMVTWLRSLGPRRVRREAEREAARHRRAERKHKKMKQQQLQQQQEQQQHPQVQPDSQHHHAANHHAHVEVVAGR